MTDTDINRVYLSENFKVLGGVCSGIAISRGWSISLTRIVTIFAMSASLGAVLVVYLLAWMLLPPASARPYIESSQPPMDPLMRSERNRMLGGVCAGIADLLGVGAGTVRIVFMILLIFGGLSLAPYLYAWVVIPKRLH